MDDADDTRLAEGHMQRVWRRPLRAGNARGKSRNPLTKLNPDGEDQAAHEMKLIARSVLTGGML